MLVLQLWLAIVMVIVHLYEQLIDCRRNAIVCGCIRGLLEVRGTFMLDFHIVG